MNWFTRLCRRTGRAIHEIVKPVDAPGRKRELSRQEQQRRVSPTVTLRRTTIEEVEFKPTLEGDDDGRR